ncbi:MAG: ATP-dependent zinc metalloprotease FtsH [Thermodesulfobacteriota bacterium]
MGRIIQNSIILAILVLFGAAGYFFYALEQRLPPIKYNEFLASLDNNEVVEVHLKGGAITVSDIYGRRFTTFSPDVASLMPRLMEKQVAISADSDRPSPFWNFATITLPIVLLLTIWLVINLRQRHQSEENSEFAKDRAILPAPGTKHVTFGDVAGIPEAKEELVEIIEFLKDPQRFSRLGASIPKGVLLQGPPGTGKTLLAKAIAGEAGVPFYSFSGSDFVEMFVGVGASRVRDLFREAKQHTPCIVFIDEIDAVGAHRAAAGAVGGQDERSQTLNALLVEMDGFGRDDTIIVLAATNRPDILDPALLRPGRFDRQITILPPDIKGRSKILEVHARRVAMDAAVDLYEIARNTPGFTGAELANLVNEAALIAARANKNGIEMEDFERAKDRILMGVERKGLVISENDRRTMAYHEAGHAIVARFMPESDPLHKITIIPRGKAMGHTQQLPLNDRHAYSKTYLRTRVTILMGGRAAEEVGLKQQTTGAEDDLIRATEIATRMVCQWGMDEVIGPLAYARSESAFLGNTLTSTALSENIARHIDQEVKRLVDGCYQDALAILSRERDFLRHLAEILLQTETLDREEMEIIFDCSKKKSRDKGADDSLPLETGESLLHACNICPASAHCAEKPLKTKAA